MLNDAGSKIEKAALSSFLTESSVIVEKLKISLSQFKSVTDVVQFENFRLQIEPFIAAAYGISFIGLGDLAQSGKELAEKAQQAKDIGKLLAIHGLLSQLIKIMEGVLVNLRKDMRPDTNQIISLLKKISEANKYV